MQDLFEQINSRPEGHGLPPRCYTDEHFLHLEIEKLLRSEWHCIGREDEIPNIGDYFTMDLLTEPLLVVRKSETDIAVLSNVCRHRCPYHAWTYELNGKLRNAPLVPKEQLVKDCGLPVLNSRCWQGFIFVSMAENSVWPDDDAKTDEGTVNSLHQLGAHVENYHMQSMHHATHFYEVWDCNWKSLVENFMDGYHLSVVHPESLHHLTPTSLCKKVPGTASFTAYTANYAATAPARVNHHPSLSTEQARQSQLFCIFPAMIASLSADTLVYLALHPLNARQVSVKWGISTFEADLPEEELQARIEKWQQINHEDHEILKHLQKGLQSSRCDTGPLAEDNFEGTLFDFHSYLINKLEINRVAGT